MIAAVTSLRAALRDDARRARLAYLAVSAFACAADFCVTMAMTNARTSTFIAAAAGYLLGLVVHWSLSVRFVFARETATDGPQRRRQAVLFVFSGLVGLCATVAIYSGVMMMGGWAPAAKALAVAVSFVLVYLFRRHLIFPLRA
jgi:putative flippase GtrA